MADRTNIEWADSTLNPWIGCTKVSPACDHCYAEARMDTRFGRVTWGAGQPRLRTSAKNWKQPLAWNALPFWMCPACSWRGDDRTVSDGHGCPECSAGDLKPARRRVFCSSLADVFDNEVDPQWRVDLFDLIARTPNLTWMLLTKRIGNVERMLDEALARMGSGLNRWADAPWPNVWIGATICNRAEMLRDAPKLARVAARVRFWSIEPMLGDIGPIPPALRPDWIICGGESGQSARPMHPDWVRNLRDRCAIASVPFLFKQWGEFVEANPNNVDVGGDRFIELDGTDSTSWTLDRHSETTAHMVNIGKRNADRELDGATHTEYPPD